MSWIGVDFDGTLATYGTWHTHGTSLGEPIPPMVERVKKWIAQDQEVRIVTARMSHGNDKERQRALIEAWCEQHLGKTLEVTCCKDYQMIQLWDDRCVQVETNTGRIIGG